MLSLLFFGTLHSNGYIFPFLLCFWLLFFSQLFVRLPQTAVLPFCISFSFALNSGDTHLQREPTFHEPWNCCGWLFRPELPTGTNLDAHLAAPSPSTGEELWVWPWVWHRKGFAQAAEEGSAGSTRARGSLCPPDRAPSWAWSAVLCSLKKWTNILYVQRFSCPHRNGWGNKLEIGDGVHKYLRMRTSNEWSQKGKLKHHL